MQNTAMSMMTVISIAVTTMTTELYYLTAPDNMGM